MRADTALPEAGPPSWTTQRRLLPSLPGRTRSHHRRSQFDPHPPAGDFLVDWPEYFESRRFVEFVEKIRILRKLPSAFLPAK